MRLRALVAFLLLGVVAPVSAQTPAFEVSAGYSWLDDDEIEEVLGGWVASATGNVNRWLGITGEVGGNYKTLELADILRPFQVVFYDADFGVVSFMAGPRFVTRRSRRLTSFFQLLGGGVRGSMTTSLGESETLTEFAMQGGVGLDVWITRNVGVQLAADVRRIFSEEPGNEKRITLGIVVSGGTR